ncbi:hypothetical protein JTB14_028120 [Gonioctena quinquepunctata]|nr:hypothetical protein JTB14_028120 [Gonioctena quinquepunctata]
MTLVVVAALSFQCTATWRWLRDRTCSKNIGCDEDCTSKQQTNIQISNSLPDLQEQVKPTYVQEIKDIVAKKVLRQTTLPIVPDRHQTFQRQLSHRLDIPTDVKFSICALERNNSSTVGLIKVTLGEFKGVDDDGLVWALATVVPPRACHELFVRKKIKGSLLLTGSQIGNLDAK